MDWERMKFLINRIPEAKFRVQQAKSFAYRDTIPMTSTACGTGGDPVPRGVLVVEAAKEQYQSLCNELDVLRAEAAPLIASLQNPLEHDAMQLRYLEGLSALEVSFRLNYSVQHIFRILARAAKKLS